MPILDVGTRRIILASQSPRRIELLKKILTRFEVQVSNVFENNNHHDPDLCALENSKQKALKIAYNVEDGIIIGADSIVVLEGTILGKPKDTSEAVWMLTQLSGHIHKVFTGYTIIEKPTNQIIQDVAVTKVKFRHLDSWEINRYIEIDHPFDKAGSYGIQDSSAVFVDWIDGCYFNVMGLPLSKLFLSLLPLFKP